MGWVPIQSLGFHLGPAKYQLCDPGQVPSSRPKSFFFKRGDLYIWTWLR